jgi:hypothetical protein
LNRSRKLPDRSRFADSNWRAILLPFILDAPGKVAD